MACNPASATRRRTVALAPWAVLAVSVVAYAAVSLFVMHQPFHLGERRLRYFDLRVFRDSAGAVLHGRPLYRAFVYRGLPLRFTYPPFAALMLVPTQLWGVTVDGIASCAINVALLAGLLALTPRLWRSGEARPGRGWGPVALLTAVALWCEPVTVTLGYGQLDLLIAVLVVFDLARPSGARGRGVAIGLAAALKLTPLIFIPYLLATRQRRTAVTATATFMATNAVAFVLLPKDAARYWGGLFLDTSRTGDTADSANQSVLGAVERLTHGEHAGAAGLLTLVVVAIVGLIVAVRAGRRGDHGVGFAVCAITSLLVSPVSWTHHWVLAIPAVAAVAVWAHRRRAWGVLAAAAGLAVVSYTYLPELAVSDTGGGLALGAVGQLLSEPYVILGLAVVVCAGVAGERRCSAMSGRDADGQPSNATSFLGASRR